MHHWPGSWRYRLGVDLREERVVFETARYRVTGTLSLPREGFRSRLTDYLNASERSFLALTDVEITPLDGEGVAERHPFLALALQHVVLAIPAQPSSA
jgi:hypothetical protein